MVQYVTEKTALEPELRFSEFSGLWSEKSLMDFNVDYRGGASLTPKDFVDSSDFQVVPKKAIVKGGKLNLSEDNPTFCTKDFFDNNQNAIINNQFLVTVLRDLVPTAPSIGLVVTYDDDEDLLLAQGVYGFKVNANLAPNFLTSLSNKESYRRLMYKLCVGSTQVHLRSSEYFKTNFVFPEIKEQQKIAGFLTAVDENLNQLRRKRELLETYKRGVMQKLFSQEIRFKQDDGSDFPDWEEKFLGDIFKRITHKNAKDCKNVLTISAQQGLINQKKYFNKSVSAKDVTGYCLISKGNFAYNKSYSKGYPMGAIKQLKDYEEGVVSTLYICFAAKIDTEIEFYDHYFDSGLLNRELHKIAQEGARNHGLLNVSVVEFFNDIKMVRPSVDEQEKISSALTTFNGKLDHLSHQITQLETFKKGLLQQMFV